MQQAGSQQAGSQGQVPAKSAEPTSPRLQTTYMMLAALCRVPPWLYARAHIEAMYRRCLMCGAGGFEEIVDKFVPPTAR